LHSLLKNKTESGVKVENADKDQSSPQENRKFMRIFSAASFLNDFGSDMIYPVWPFFVTTYLRANMAVLGFVDGLGDAIVSISQAGSGYLSDKVGKRKVFVWTGYLFGSMSRIGYALSTMWQHLIPFRILDRSGKIRGAPRDAIVADISTDENRGRNFGLLRTMDNLGAVCGIITCFLLLGLLGYTNLFLLASIPSLVSAFLILVFIKDRKTSRIYKGLSFRELSFNFKLFLFLSALFALGYFSYSFLLVYAEKAGFEKGFLPLLYLLFTAVASLGSLPFGKLADKVGRKPVLILAYVLWGLACLGFIYLTSLVSIAFLFVVYGLHRGALEPVQRAFVSELAPTDYRASMLGTFQMVVGLCALPASLTAGFLWVGLGRLAPFYFSLSLTVPTIALMLFVREWT